MKKTLCVKAPAGKICPKEGGKPAGMITDAESVTVPNNAYYRRLVNEGSLVKTAPAAKSKKQGGNE